MVEIYKEFYATIISKNIISDSFPILEGACYDDLGKKFDLYESYIVFSPNKTPYNKVETIKLGLECSPCYKSEVMKNITPQMVIDRLKKNNIIGEDR